jgi:hypothetical protein
MNQIRRVPLFQNSGPILLCALMAFGAAACQSTSSTPTAPVQHTGRVDLSDEMTAQAIVVSVDPAERLITLRREDGSMFAVEAGPAVRNFNQIAAGDVLSVRYQEKIAVSKLPAGTKTGPVEGAFVAGRAKSGEKPAGGVGLAASTRVKIESVDRVNNIVVFSLGSGELRAVRPMRAEGRDFILGLKVADIVQLDYSASLALSIDKL